MISIWPGKGEASSNRLDPSPTTLDCLKYYTAIHHVWIASGSHACITVSVGYAAQGGSTYSFWLMGQHTAVAGFTPLVFGTSEMGSNGGTTVVEPGDHRTGVQAKMWILCSWCSILFRLLGSVLCGHNLCVQ